jgi:hypothetical protein
VNRLDLLIHGIARRDVVLVVGGRPKKTIVFGGGWCGVSRYGWVVVWASEFVLEGGR